MEGEEAEAAEPAYHYNARVMRKKKERLANNDKAEIEAVKAEVAPVEMETEVKASTGHSGSGRCQ